MTRRLKTTFLVHAIVTLAFGVVLYLIPDTWAALVLRCSSGCRSSSSWALRQRGSTSIDRLSPEEDGEPNRVLPMSPPSNSRRVRRCIPDLPERRER